MLVDETLAAYIQIRTSGKNAKTALETLRARIDGMTSADRGILVRRVKEWEDEHRKAPDDAKTPAQSVAPRSPAPGIIKQLGGAKAPCPRCGKPNKIGEVFCAECGAFLSGSSPNETTLLQDIDLAPYSNDYFGENSTLVLVVASDNTSYPIQPQRFSHETVIGRSEGGAMTPDIDLSAHNASKMGVSRLHVSITYNAENHMLSVSDMKSANGTYINGQKLFPQEVRVLRSGDELRVGRLVLRAHFQHPDNT